MSTTYRSYRYIPKEVWKKSVFGSSPTLLRNLTDELKGAKKISISFFLYNNPYLQVFLEQLALEGCEVKVYSIPASGYTNKEVFVYPDEYYMDDHKIKTSKYKYASKTYNRIYAENTGVNLCIFPHTYIWRRQLYSRGKDLYSLHNKSIFAEFKDGSTKCISSSCNFALGDPPHSDNFLVIENSNNAEKMFRLYFKLLEENSIPVKEYALWMKQKYDFEFIVEPVDIEDTYFTDYFVAPFVKYNGIGSNHYIQQRIIEFIQTAQHRVFICSQHFSDINSFDDNADSLVERIRSLDKKIEVKILKQTRADNQKQGERTEQAEVALMECENISQRCWNPVIHDKFIIVDNKILITTGNFTPTQFAWHEGRDMTYEVVRANGVKDTYRVQNTFSEVNSYHFVEDKELVDEYLSHFNALWDKSVEI